ncbi:hypothetical protein [Pedobacter endophyticus]|uniref:Uncharacterized protein n=1 Tax=Pedobacter endophyticus TaxID=2789740 RepID=A0A7U3SQ25_9SPHI|nr:hypothetical protein [Pedobacter endophyticus]QPH37856.1 hypothetical protein IZT61_12115 [Pedobacter endophyticus]
MQVNRNIINGILKEAHSTEVDYKSSSNLIPLNEGINKVVEHIHTAFDQSITKYSTVDKLNTGNAVYKNIDRYLKTDNHDGQFIQFSKTSLSDLALLIKREEKYINKKAVLYNSRKLVSFKGKKNLPTV